MLVKIAQRPEGYIVSFENFLEAQAFGEFFRKTAAKTNGHFSIHVKRPFRPRTTGKRSQNARLNGHIQFFCQATGNDFESVKIEVKTRAVDMGYPFKTGMRGEVIPKSEADASVEECALLCDAMLQLAAEFDLILPEYTEEEYEADFDIED